MPLSLSLVIAYITANHRKSGPETGLPMSPEWWQYLLSDCRLSSRDCSPDSAVRRYLRDPDDCLDL